MVFDGQNYRVIEGVCLAIINRAERTCYAVIELAIVIMNPTTITSTTIHPTSTIENDG